MEKIFSSVEDVLADESFLAWYHQESTEKIQAWEQWLSTHIESKPLVDEAILLMSRLHVDEKPLTGERIELASGRLNAAIDELATDTPVVAIKTTSRRWWIRMTAAAAILVFAGFAVWKFTRSDKETLCTAYGQLKQHVLPDGSEVMLNANSSVKFGNQWDGGADREVWLKGEAFFHVKKTSARDRFIVHTEHMDVIVTGTQFNVITRNDKSNVLLTEGSVTIRSKDGKEIKMVPGDFVELNGNAQPEKKIGNEEAILAWKDNKLFFENTPMTEAARIISNHYGIKVTLDGDAIRNDSLLGIMQNDNLDILLRSLEAAKNFKITRKDNEIIISKL